MNEFQKEAAAAYSNIVKKEYSINILECRTCTYVMIIVDF
jgi:hypothetical protein